MGTVHRALDLQTGCEVALKCVSTPNAEDLYRLKREFRGIAGVRHPNLVRHYELFVEGSSAAFSMELVLGSTLHQFAHRAGRCNYGALMSAAKQLAAALSALHAAGKVHRDVKPSNVRVTSAGRVVLLDLGLATSLSPRTRSTQRTGVLLGTPGYVAPEQARGEALTPAADWYSFGVTLFETLTGVLPFEFNASVPAQRGDQMIRVKSILPDVPPELDELVGALLDPLPGRRPDEYRVMRVLSGSSGAAKPPTSNVASQAMPAYEELPEEALVLARAFEQTRRGRPAILRWANQPGTSDAARAARFADDLQSLGALVLRGRCRTNETVALNALDEVMDELCHAMAHLSYAELVYVLPPNVAALASLFPVLGRLATPADGAFTSRYESRAETAQRGRRALRQLLSGLAASRPLVVWIDDAHLGDRESGELLSELLVSPSAPPMLLVLGYQREEAASQGMLDVLTRSTGGVARFDVPLRG
jgi:hypothetical protein